MPTFFVISYSEHHFELRFHPYLIFHLLGLKNIWYYHCCFHKFYRNLQLVCYNATSYHQKSHRYVHQIRFQNHLQIPLYNLWQRLLHCLSLNHPYTMYRSSCHRIDPVPVCQNRWYQTLLSYRFRSHIPPLYHFHRAAEYH